MANAIKKVGKKFNDAQDWVTGTRWNQFRQKEEELGITGEDMLVNKKKQAYRARIKDAADDRLLSQAAKKGRRDEAFNSKESQEWRQEFDKIASRSTHSGGETMEKYAQMIDMMAKNILFGRSHFNSILNKLWDMPGFIRSKLPHKGAPVKSLRPSDVLIVDKNGKLGFNPECKATNEEKDLALNLFRLHMAVNGHSETGKEGGFPTYNCPPHELNDRIKTADENIKQALGKKIAWQEAPENDDTARPGV